MSYSQKVAEDNDHRKQQARVQEKRELQQKQAPKFLCEDHFGRPTCPACGLKLQYPDRHYAFGEKAWILACRGKHFWRLSIGERGQKIFEEITSTDPRHPHNQEGAH